MQTHRDRPAALALLLGTAGAILTMVLHPSEGTTYADLEGRPHAVALAAWVHGLALASMAGQFVGLVGVRAWLGPRIGARAGLVAFAAAAIAVSCAGTISGLTVPGMARALEGADEARRARLHDVLVGYRVQVGAFTLVFFVATCAGVLAWSIALWDRARGLAGLGLVVASGGFGALASGHLTDHLHPLAVFIAVEAVWLIGLGTRLWRGEGPE